MLYEQYQQKIAKVARFRNTLRRYRFLILGIFALIVAATAACLSVKGIVRDTVPCPQEIYYGEELSYRASAVMSRVSYEYREKGGEWTDERPLKAGDYQVRAVSEKTFGGKGYGAVHAFSVLPKPLDVLIAQDTLPYGDMPEVTAALSYGDTISCDGFLFDDEFSSAPTVKAELDRVVISDRSGGDVTDCYLLSAVPRTVTVTPREITVTLADASRVYDGTPFSLEEFELTKGSLVDGDEIEGELFTSPTDAGTWKNTATFRVFRDGGEVTERYRIEIVAGTLTIEKRELVVETDGAEKTYDGTPLTNKNFHVSEETPLPNGHSVAEVVFSGTVTDVSVVPNSADNAVLKDGSGNDVTANYSISYRFGELTVTPRPVTVKTASAQAEYSGLPFSSKEWTVISDTGFLSGHTVSAERFSSVTDAGTLSNELALAVYEGERAVTANYDISYECGTLAVLPRAVTVRAGSAELYYRAEPLTYPCAETSAGELAEGDSFGEILMTTESAITDVGVCKNTILSLTVLRGEKDVTQNYVFTYEEGQITVLPLPVTVTAGSAVKEYDGEELRCGEWNADPALPSADEFICKMTEESAITAIGLHGNEIGEIKAFRKSDGREVTQNYDFTFESGTLEVVRRVVTLKTLSATKVYDGTPLSCNQYELTAHDGKEALVGGDRITVTFSGAITNVWMSFSGNNYAEVTALTDEYGNSVLENYQIEYEFGTLTVTPRPVILVTDSAEKVYDGTPLTCGTYEILPADGFSFALVEGHTVQLLTAEGIVDAGSRENNLTVAVLDGTYDVTKNYSISVEYGMLTVQKREIHIQTDSASWVYDGNPHSADGQSYCEDTPYCFLREHTLISYNVPGITDVVYTEDGGIGSIENDFDFYIYDHFKDCDVTENYLVVVTYGYLTVTPRPITVSTESEEWVYDGKPHSNHNFSISGTFAEGQYPIAGDFTEVTDVMFDGEGNVIGCDNRMEIRVYSQEKDVTANYAVTYEWGTLVILPLPVGIRTGSQMWVYDNQEHFCTVYDFFYYGEPIGTHELKVTGYTTLTDVKCNESGYWDWTDNVLTFAVFEGDKDVTSNYQLKIEYGSIAIVPYPFYISSGDAMEYYMDSEQRVTSSEIFFNTDHLPRGVFSYTGDLYCEGEQKGLGGSRNLLIASDDFSWTVTDGDTDVSANYELFLLPGSLNIIARPLTVITQSAGKPYDGTPLTAPEFWLLDDVLSDGSYAVLPGHELVVEVTGYIDSLGIAENTAEVRVIRTSDGADVSDVYDITLRSGTLQLYKRELTVTTGSAQKEYDGTPLTCNEFSWEGDLAEGDTIQITVTGEVTQGARENACEVMVTAPNGTDVTDHYKIDYLLGTLVVLNGPSPVVGGGVLDESGNIGGGGGGGDGDKVAVARIKSDSSGSIYLRYLSYGDYRGGGWGISADYDGLIDDTYCMNYLTGAALDYSGYGRAMAQINLLTNNYLLPYYLGMGGGNYTVQKSDVRYTGSGSDFSCEYFLFDIMNAYSAFSVPYELTEAEKMYRDYVYQTYLAVPATTRAYLETVIRDNGFGNDYPVQTIQQVAYYVRNAAAYNKKYPIGLDLASDMVVAFLRDYKEGVCRHYASAATLLLRTLGIPARYVIGYVGTTVAGAWTTVTSDSAHAWVEAYIDGMGWVQVEVTGSGFNNGIENILPKELTVKPVDLFQSLSDGATLYASYEIEENSDLGFLWQLGYYYDVAVDGRQIGAGRSHSRIEHFILYDPDGVDVTGRFEITYEYGILQIYTDIVRVSVSEHKYVYDGTFHAYSESDFRILSSSIATIEIRLTDTVGRKYANKELRESELRSAIGVFDGNTDITDTTYVVFEGTLMQIVKRSITVKSADEQFMYDGEVHKGSYAWVAQGGLAGGDGLKVSFTDGTDYGEAENAFNVKIIDGDGVDVTENYEIKCEFGTLTVF